MQKKYIALVHHPIINKRAELVTTSVTNLDIHDIARTARTFGFDKYFIVTPLELQKNLVAKILGHWEEEQASQYNPDRHNALSNVMVVNSVEECESWIKSQSGQDSIILAATGANFKNYHGESKDLLQLAESEKKDILLIFGTGWGLHPDLLKKMNFYLKPIHGSAQDGYNHLSVRSAAAIYCSQLAN